MSQEYITVTCPLIFQITWHGAKDTAKLPRNERLWVDVQQGVVGSWDEFENYSWPKHRSEDFFAMECVAKKLPEGIMIVFMGPGGQLENTIQLMGMTNLALNLTDDLALVETVSEKVGKMLIDIL